MLSHRKEPASGLRSLHWTRAFLSPSLVSHTHTQHRQTDTDRQTHTAHTHTFPPSIPPLFFSAGESVFARCLSSLKEERTQASKILKGPSSKFQEDKKAFVEHVRKVSGSCLTARGVQLLLAHRCLFLQLFSELSETYKLSWVYSP